MVTTSPFSASTAEASGRYGSGLAGRVPGSCAVSRCSEGGVASQRVRNGGTVTPVVSTVTSTVSTGAAFGSTAAADGSTGTVDGAEAKSKAEVRSPATWRRHELMLGSSTPSQRSTKRIVEVWSKVSEQTCPPVVQGETIVVGTR